MTSPDCVRASNSQTHFFFSSDSAGWHLTGLMWHLRSFFPTFFYKQLTLYLVLVLVLAQERLGEDVDKFGEVLKVLGHLGGQHHVDDTLPNDFVAFSVQSFNVQRHVRIKGNNNL